MSLDRSIPGSATLDDWPTPPVPPFQIAFCDILIDACGPRHTYILDLVDAQGKHFPFFFDGFLGRLCYGSHHTDEDAAFIRRGSRLESEAFSAIQAAAPSSEDPKTVLNRLEHAKHWSGLTLDDA